MTEIRNVIHMNSGPHLANAQPVRKEWTAPHAVWLTAATLWTGCDRGQVADIAMHLWRKSDGALLAWVHWDHYSEPTALHTDYRCWWPRYWTLSAGDSLVLQSIGHNIAPPTLNVHHIALIEWMMPQG